LSHDFRQRRQDFATLVSRNLTCQGLELTLDPFPRLATRLERRTASQRPRGKVANPRVQALRNLNPI
jgi:hypothetical protein